jgi:hypothetical protein
MQIPLQDPLAGYPQPYASWASMLHNDAEDQGDEGADRNVAGSSPAQTPLYTVDITA